MSLKLTADEDERDFLRFVLEYDKFRAKREGVRKISVELKETKWTWAKVEAESLKILSEYCDQHPTATCRSIATALPELGSHVTISKLMRKLNQGKS